MRGLHSFRLVVALFCVSSLAITPSLGWAFASLNDSPRCRRTGSNGFQQAALEAGAAFYRRPLLAEAWKARIHRLAQAFSVPNPPLHRGMIQHRFINQAIRTTLGQGKIYKVWARADRLEEDVPLFFDSSEQRFIENAAHTLDTQQRSLLSHTAVAIVEGDDFVYYADRDHFEALHVGVARSTIYIAQGLWETLRENPEALAGALAHGLSHRRWSWLPALPWNQPGEWLAVRAEKKADPRQQLRLALSASVSVPYRVRKHLDVLIGEMLSWEAQKLWKVEALTPESFAVQGTAHYWQMTLHLTPQESETVVQLLRPALESSYRFLSLPIPPEQPRLTSKWIYSLLAEKRDRYVAAFQTLSRALLVDAATQHAIDAWPVDVPVSIEGVRYTKAGLRRAVKELEVVYRSGLWVRRNELTPDGRPPVRPPQARRLGEIQDISSDDFSRSLEPLEPDITRRHTEAGEKINRFNARVAEVLNAASAEQRAPHAEWVQKLFTLHALTSNERLGGLGPQEIHRSIAGLLEELNWFFELFGLPAFLTSDISWELSQDALADIVLEHRGGKAISQSVTWAMIEARIVAGIAAYYGLEGLPMIWAHLPPSLKNGLSHALDRDERHELVVALSEVAPAAWEQLTRSLVGIWQGDLTRQTSVQFAPHSKSVQNALRQLSLRERRILEMRTSYGMTLSEISAKLPRLEGGAKPLSRERIRQILESSLRRVAAILSANRSKNTAEYYNKTTSPEFVVSAEEHFLRLSSRAQSSPAVWQSEWQVGTVNRPAMLASKRLIAAVVDPPFRHAQRTPFVQIYSFDMTGQGRKVGDFPLGRRHESVQWMDFRANGDIVVIFPTSLTILRFEGGRWNELQSIFAVSDERFLTAALNPSGTLLALGGSPGYVGLVDVTGPNNLALMGERRNMPNPIVSVRFNRDILESIDVKGSSYFWKTSDPTTLLRWLSRPHRKSAVRQAA